MLTLGLDLACWIGALLAALAIRFGFSPPAEEVGTALLFAPFLLVLQALIGDFAGAYRPKRYVSGLDEAVALAGSTLLATAAGTAFNALLEDPPLPQSVPLAGGFLALVGMFAVRWLRQALAERRLEASGEDAADPERR